MLNSFKEYIYGIVEELFLQVGAIKYVNKTIKTID
jgi:hypothetical protein